MKIYLGADHRGFKLKEKLKGWLKDQKIECEDLGNTQYEIEDDFPDFGKKVAEKVQTTGEKGILLCGSGGMALVANKFKGVWSAEAYDVERAKHAKEHDGVNVLSIPADVVDEKTACEMVRVWLETEVEQKEKYQRRLDKIKAIEERNFV
ncbi:MAG: RpiB/LacA/LacB family sugar-phosphate isomerase [Candidatus Beckwithbacteria bacterium]|nr:RpiB/LacA/LacB family sugar-phosphate isomerase [Candidatus Beckwithbacteria bacterium]